MIYLNLFIIAECGCTQPEGQTGRLFTNNESMVNSLTDTPPSKAVWIWMSQCCGADFVQGTVCTVGEIKQLVLITLLSTSSDQPLEQMPAMIRAQTVWIQH